MGEGTDVCESAGGEATEANIRSPKEKDGESESVGNHGRCIMDERDIFPCYGAIAHKH